MTFVEYLSAAKDTVTIGAAFFAGYIAWQGLSTWRRQLKGNVQYELARRLLRATYKVRDGMRAARNSVILAGEFQQAMREAAQGDSKEKDDLENASKNGEMVYNMRWKRVSDAFSDLSLEATEAEVVWGKEYRERLDPLYKCGSELYSTFGLYLREKGRERNQHLSNPEKSFDRMERYERIIWEGVSDVDEFGKKIEEAVATIESHTKPHLKI